MDSKALLVTLAIVGAAALSACDPTIHSEHNLRPDRPEPIPHGGFSIEVIARDDAGGKFNTRTVFDSATGWQFGDREAYRCAWVEHLTDGELDFEIHYQLMVDYEDARIGDRRGVEGDQSDLCGVESGVSDTPDGSDHFPHSTSLVFYRDGAEFDRIEYPVRCGNLYWTSGDEGGEAWLWWDEDGASDMVKHGDGLCEGGSGEPEPVVHAQVLELAPGIRVCSTNSMLGDLCKGAKVIA